MQRMRQCIFLRRYASDDFAMKENPKYVNKVVAPTMELSEVDRWVSHVARLFV